MLKKLKMFLREIYSPSFFDKALDKKHRRGAFGPALRCSSLMVFYIFSGAETPMMSRDRAMTRRTVSARKSLASRTPSAAPLMRQAV